MALTARYKIIKFCYMGGIGRYGSHAMGGVAKKYRVDFNDFLLNRKNFFYYLY